ncbi:hypothetical protein ACWD3J_24480 [Streptomyces sp. NPDC002755]|uniref:hypothetical protein n=1 Tax=Streptomyces sp. NPDC002884 TaxID=3154544 RepID=UPI0033249826
MADGSRDVLAPAPRGVEAAVCDTDGVITDSARVHAAAWKTASDTFLTENPPEDPARGRPFDSGCDCLRDVDGRSRLDGAAAFAASRGLALVVGVDRTADPDTRARLVRHGAGIVVDDLGELLGEGARR